MLALFILILASLFQPRLNYGDTVSGTISDEISSHTYQFMGAARDVIVIEMLSVDRSLDNPLSEPVLKLANARGDILVDTLVVFPVDDTVLVAELPTSGIYTIIATRDETVPEPATGDFTLTLRLMPEIVDRINSSISTDDYGQHYFVRSTEPFNLLYQKGDGGFYPQIIVNRLNPERGGLATIATLHGDKLTIGMMGTFEAANTYIISVQQEPFDYYFETVNTAYELAIIKDIAFGYPQNIGGER